MPNRFKNKGKSRHRKHDNFKLPGIPQLGRRIKRVAPQSEAVAPVTTPAAETPATDTADNS
jgi:hypothetical protein